MHVSSLGNWIIVFVSSQRSIGSMTVHRVCRKESDHDSVDVQAGLSLYSVATSIRCMNNKDLNQGVQWELDFCYLSNYCIRTNYHTLRLGFFKTSGRTWGKICIYLLWIQDQQMIYLTMLMQFFFLIFFIKAYVASFHLNCIYNLMQFK